MSVLVPRFGIEVSIYFDASEPLLHVTEGGLALQISSPSGNEADATCISVLDKGGFFWTSSWTLVVLCTG
jgi:hypothetical protein